MACATPGRPWPSSKASTLESCRSVGHSTIAITLGIYSHVSPTLHDEAANLIASLILT